jgi:ribose 5-phosphate isomerase B
MGKKPIVISADHRGFRLKNTVAKEIERLGFAVTDLGVFDDKSVDYPDRAEELVKAILTGAAERGVLVCGSGIGMSIAANRFNGIRAALCHDECAARLSRLHNDSNILVLGERVLGEATALGILSVWLSTPFEGGRHERRVKKLDGLNS